VVRRREAIVPSSWVVGALGAPTTCIFQTIQLLNTYDNRRLITASN